MEYCKRDGQIASMSWRLHSVPGGALHQRLPAHAQKLYLAHSSEPPLTLSMDSPAVSRALRRLFSHETCSRQRFSALPRVAPVSGLKPWVRTESTSSKPKRREGSTPDSDWHVRDDMLTPDKSKEFERYPWLTADELRGRRQRPRRVKMLMRDFIEGMAF